MDCHECSIGKLKNIKCPICLGEGFIKTKDKPTLVDMKRIAARALQRKGFTMRNIQKILGYKSVSTVKFLLD